MILDKSDKYSIKQIICSIVLALGGIVWFANFSIGLYKIALSIVLLILCFDYILKPRIKQFKHLLLLIFATIISNIITTYSNADYNYLILFAMVEHIFLFIIGYHFASNNLITNKFIFSIILIIGTISSLTVTNYFIGIPNWVSPIENLRIEELAEQNITLDVMNLYSSGFGLGRTGWSTTLSLFIPLSLICIERQYMPKTSKLLLCILLSSIIVSGSRGGMLSACTILLIYNFHYYKKGVSKKKILFTIIIISIFTIILLLNIDSLMNYLRLDGEDVTSGRDKQYKLIPKMINEMGFWGLGQNGSKTFLIKHGVGHELHNSYFRNFIDNGWIVATLIFAYTWYIIKHTYKLSRSAIYKDEWLYSLILISGLISAMFEPYAIYCARSWYTIWWFTLGVFMYYKNNMINKSLYLINH